MISTIKSGIASYLNHYSKAKTRQLLIGLDDDLLNRASISRDLLQRGVDYWPWQITENQGATTNATTQKTAVLKSITTDVSATTNLDATPVVENEAATEKAA